MWKPPVSFFSQIGPDKWGRYCYLILGNLRPAGKSPQKAYNRLCEIGAVKLDTYTGRGPKGLPRGFSEGITDSGQ